MTGRTKVRAVGMARKLSGRRSPDMTIQTFLQTVFLGAYAVYHNIVAMPVEKLHMSPSHDLGRFYALLAVRNSQLRLEVKGIVGIRYAGQCEQSRGDTRKKCENYTLQWSPNAMSMYPVGHTSAQI